MKHIDNRGALTLTKKKLIITLGAVLGVALITWGVLMVSIFGKSGDADKENAAEQPVPEGYMGVYLPTKVAEYSLDGKVINCKKYKYDIPGRTVEIIEEENYGERQYIETYEYDEKGKLIRNASESFRAGEKIHDRLEELVYDSEGLLKERTQTDGNGTIWYGYSYNREGKLIRAAEYHTVYLAEKWGRTTFYDDNGNPLRSVLYDQRGGESVEWENTYSDTGLLLENVYYQLAVQRIVYEYDSAGRTMRQQEYYDDALMKEIVWPEEGKCLTYNSKDDAEQGIVLYLQKEESFDEKGYPISTRTYGKDGSLLSEESYVWEYDENGYVTIEKRYYDGEQSWWHEYEYTDLSKQAQSWAKCISKREDGSIEYTAEKDYFVNADGTISVVKNMRYFEDSSKSGFYYTFDEHGNPKKKIEVREDGTTYISEKREYERVLIPITE